MNKEISANSILSHYRIVPKLGASDNLNFIAAEYVEGETLREFARREDLTVHQ